MTKLLFAGTIFSSAFLLFLVQPIISKFILPWFGGSAAVWATCMMFFQLVLLAGYAYSDFITRRLKPRHQALLHIALLLTSLAVLPILPDASWQPQGGEDPTLFILALLMASIGLPYFLLSTTGPLIQAWVARSGVDAHVYRYFSLSNLASLIALISYPFLIEPLAALRAQGDGWSWVFLVFVILCSASAIYFMRHASAPQPSHRDVRAADGHPPTRREMLLWIGLAGVASWLLVAITNHITQNVAAIPFLWLLPLTLYLLTFVLCFESDRWYRRNWFVLPTTLLLLTCALGLVVSSLGFAIKVAVPLYSIGLFAFCMFAHGELAQRRPAPRHLTRFYLMVSIGGALGGFMVGMVAPRVLDAYYELGIGFVLLALLGVAVFWPRRGWAIGAGLAALMCTVLLVQQVRDDRDGAHVMLRSFYGTVKTVDIRDDDPRENMRQLYHGSIKHGEQFLDPARRSEPTAYYGRSAGVGLAIAQAQERSDNRVGLIGLGVGTLALYGRPGDVYRFYEINPQVIQLADTDFSFLRDSAAKVETVLGDARLSMEREAPQQYDVLAVDAFSGDSVPVHLITREAMAVYLRHMRPDGIVAFHVTNRFLNLPPVLQKIAQEQGLHTLLIRDEAEVVGDALRKTDWVLVSRDAKALQHPRFAKSAKPITPIQGLRVWSDDFNNLFDVLK